MTPNSQEVGMVYLLHLDRPVSKAHTSQHYIGWCRRNMLEKRLARHASGDGNPMLRAAKLRRIDWRVAKIWDRETRGFERRLKNRKNAKRLCPICRGEVK